MVPMIRRTIDLGLRAAPLAAYAAAIRRDAIGFLYHVISDRPLPHVRHLYSYKTPEEFRRDLIWLSSRFHLVSPGELSSSRPVGGRPRAFVTFDDGFAECYSVVRPILFELGIPCAFFITTDFIDNRRLFYRHRASLCVESILSRNESEVADLTRDLRGARRSPNDAPVIAPAAGRAEFIEWILGLSESDEQWIEAVSDTLGIDTQRYLIEHRPYLTAGEIARLDRDGFQMGSHGVTHGHLHRSGPDAIEQEIVTSSRAIMELTGRDHVSFAFPHSADGIDRGFLGRLLSRHRFIDALYDTRGLRKDVGFIRNRIVVDRPASGGSPRSGLIEALHAAYREALIETVRSGSRHLGAAFRSARGLRP